MLVRRYRVPTAARWYHAVRDVGRPDARAVVIASVGMRVEVMR
jgi:hypothetical protein